MSEDLETRVTKLNRFLTGPGGFPHCCAMLIFNQDFKLTYTSPMVARLFGISVIDKHDVYFQDVFSDHEQLELNKLSQYSIISEDWATSSITVSHQNRNISRRLKACCLAFPHAEGTSLLYSFCFDDNALTPTLFSNLFKRAIKISPDGIAKIALRIDGEDKSLINQSFEYFDEGLCNLFEMPRAQLLNASLISLLAPTQTSSSQYVWEMALNGYIDGYSCYKEFVDTKGNIVCTRITPFALSHSDETREYLLMFSEVPRDTSAAVSSFSADALIAGLSHTNTAIVCIEDDWITYANDVLLSWMGPLRRDGLDLISWLNEITPEHRKNIRKQWERGIRRNQPFTLELLLKSDPLTPLKLTVIPQKNTVGERVIKQLLLIGVKQDIELVQKFAPEVLPQIASNTRHPLTGASGMDALTKTERRVAQLIKEGYSSKEIARDLDISPGTVNIHRKNIRRKLNLTGEKVNLTLALSK